MRDILFEESNPSRANDERPPVVWMFSGQGSQYYRMGQSLYEEDTVFRNEVDKLDELVVARIGVSIVDTIYTQKHPRNKIFDETRLTHPALFIVQYALAKSLIGFGFPKPDYILGASLGEFVGAALAQCCSASGMLEQLLDQASLLEQYCEKGAMIAVLEGADLFHHTPLLNENCELAGVNFSGSFVISGKEKEMKEVANYLIDIDALHQVLPVNLAFHSSSMDKAKVAFMEKFKNSKYIYSKPTIPIISCLKVNTSNSTFTTEYWWDVVRTPIFFQEAFQKFYMLQPNTLYLDLSPSGTMTNLVKYNLPKNSRSVALPLMIPWGKSSDLIADAWIKLNGTQQG